MTDDRKIEIEEIRMKEEKVNAVTKEDIERQLELNRRKSRELSIRKKRLSIEEIQLSIKRDELIMDYEVLDR